MFSGDAIFKMCGFLDFNKCGMQAWEVAKVPRTLIPNIRSKRFIGVSNVPVKLIAEALLTRISKLPNASMA
jgi:hypothetical protein